MPLIVLVNKATLAKVADVLVSINAGMVCAILWPKIASLVREIALALVVRSVKVASV